jgi:hypothetical protein
VDEIPAWVLLDAGSFDSPPSRSGDIELSAFFTEGAVSELGLDPPTLPPAGLHAGQTSEGEGHAGSTLDQAGYLAMYGRYTTQATARVERAWLRSRTPIAGGQFHCTVRIEQGPSGDVRSTELINCNGDSEWQESLVFAIERSSPLPAPPDPAVFSPQLILSFSAAAYVEGVSREEEYEQVRPRVVATSR